MQYNKSDILSESAEYYSSKIAQFGETPRGVDWNGKESQTIRFEQLCKIIKTQGPFSINDLGCGYGALYDFLDEQYDEFSYFGIDISTAMIEAAKLRYQHKDGVNFIISDQPSQESDFSIASGIFNVRASRSDDEWYKYIEDTLDVLDNSSRLGFSFNCLTSYSDPDKMVNHLFYGDPCKLFNLCKKRFSTNVALLHDYGLYEFTILVRK